MVAIARSPLRSILEEMAPPGPLRIPALPAPVVADWPVPGSKSITNRALVLAALAEGTTVITNVLESDDTAHMRAALAALGIRVRPGAAGSLLVEGGRSLLRPAAQPLFLGNSGTSVRFLSALAALVPGVTTITGDEHMAKRPIADLVEALRALGVRVDCPSGCPPLTIHGGAIAAQEVMLRADRSSQYLSALLLALGASGRALTIRLAGELVSRPYVEMTCRMVADFGGRIEGARDHFRIAATGAYRPRTYAVEPDASAASYAFALAAAGGHRIRVPGLDQGSLQGDYRFLEVLERMGARVERGQGSTTVIGTGRLDGVDAAMRDISDTVMTLAAIAPLAAGPVSIRDVANIRIKETDRLAATVAELERLGQRVEHGEDWLTIHQAPLRPAVVRCYADHRMAMSFGILGALAAQVAEPGIAIEDPACSSKTYPGFWSDLARLYPHAPW